MKKFALLISVLVLLGIGCSSSQQTKVVKADNEEYFTECRENKDRVMNERCRANNITNLDIKDLLACHTYTHNKENYLLFDSNCLKKKEGYDWISDFTNDTSINNLTTSSQYIIAINKKCSQKIINLTPKELIGCLEYFRPDLAEPNTKE